MNKTKTKWESQHSRNMLWQMLLIFLVLGAVFSWQIDLLFQVYLENQANALGWVVNGCIVALFTGGVVLLIKRFFGYRNEESNIARFMYNEKNGNEPLEGVDWNCMIGERYRTLQELNQQLADINQSALAATLQANESSRNSFLRFVHNVLILTGVFGTIVSLSLSLVGASEIISGVDQSAGSVNGLGVMFFGMSTALSTTMTAILAYLIFSYFYIKLTDTQTYLISQIETITVAKLLPQFQPNRDAVANDYSNSIRSASKLIWQFEQSQEKYAQSVTTLHEATQLLSKKLALLNQEEHTNKLKLENLVKISEYQQKSNNENRKQLSEVIELLRKGFRLTE